jgi:hypothetical protein
VEEIEWGNGVKSFYFHDPARERAREIADGDLWPKAQTKTRRLDAAGRLCGAEARRGG